MKRLLREVGTKLELDFAKPAFVHSTVFEDNTCALGMATTPKMSPRTKHIAVKYHFFKSHIGVPGDKTKEIHITHIASEKQKADIFTKGLTADTFKVIRKLLMGW